MGKVHSRFAVLGSMLMSSAMLMLGQETPPIPVLSAGGSAPKGAENNYVFLDPRSGDAVALYTADGKPAGLNPFAQSVTRVNIKLGRHVAPVVRTSISAVSNTGEFHYRYAFSNGPEAREIAWKWLLDELGTDDMNATRTPSNWISKAPISRVGSLSISDNFRQADPHLRSLQFLATDSQNALSPASGIKPGTSLAGFELMSRRSPGLMHVLVQGGFYIPTFPDEPPEAVSEQVDRIIRSTYNYGSAFAIGPRFALGTPSGAIVAEYVRDLEKIENANFPGVSKTFVKELKTILQSAPTPHSLEVASGLAKTAFEQEIIKAIKMALQAAA